MQYHLTISGDPISRPAELERACLLAHAWFPILAITASTVTHRSCSEWVTSK